MELKTIPTHHVPVHYYVGGQGQALVYLHAAGGLTDADPFLAALAAATTSVSPSPLCSAARASSG